MAWELLFLLLPVAAFSGWLIGRRGGTRGDGAHCALSDDYFRGLNYLLNEQSDKALEVFIHMVEVDSETVETHFALGNLFLRRGEVDRAIRIHQNLIARPTLTQNQRQQALYELGRDYLRAGLLDRAEALFKQVAESNEFGPLALRQLLDLYQLEKEWSHAVDTAHRLARVTNDDSLAPMVSHFHCEEAEEALRHGAYLEASRYLRKALAQDPKSVRATLLAAKVAAAEGDFRTAVRTLQKVEMQDLAYVTEVLPLLHNYYTQLNAVDELVVHLDGLLASGHHHTDTAILQSTLLKQRGEVDEARALLQRYVADQPTLRGVSELIEQKLKSNVGADSNELAALAQLIRHVQDGKPAYRCRSCGYATRTLHWQCPSCKGWGSIKPLSESELE